MADRFQYDSKKTIYRAIELELDGKIYPVRKLDHATMEMMDKFDEDVAKGHSSYSFERLEYLLKLKSPNSVVRSMPLEAVNEAIRYIFQRVQFPERDLKAEEKNVIGPGKTE